MVAIFLFSSQHGRQSAGLSDIVVHVLQRITGHTVTDVGAETLQFVVRKAGHTTEYLLLGVLLVVAWRVTARWRRTIVSPTYDARAASSTRPSRGPAGGLAPGGRGSFGDRLRRHTYWLGPWLIAVCYAATDETHQLFVPGRSGQVRDVLIDSVGAAIGVLLATLAARRLARRRLITSA